SSNSSLQSRDPTPTFVRCVPTRPVKGGRAVRLVVSGSKPNEQADTAEDNHTPEQGELSPCDPSRRGGGGKATPPSKMKKTSGDKDSDEYRQRRERNNLAVKKSRMRSKQKAQDTQQRVNELKEENERLEAKIKLLSKELSVLKDLFLEHAHNLADNVQAPGAEGASPAHNNNNNINNNNGAYWFS
ncbi:unnamed protein product, partial [Coregonus sp. 'balchen']